ncbi:MAG TPA: MFS transporter [Bacilli bacterium]
MASPSNSMAKTPNASTTVYPILIAISVVHLLNDTMQSTISALFPILKDTLHLSYTQIGFIAFAMSITASLLQPAIGLYADYRPKPYILPIGVCFTLAGVVSLALAPSYIYILLAVISIGIGSAIFHPESSRVAYLASGGKRGLAQSIFQVGGNIGSSLGPVITALVLVPLGQFGVIWFSFAAVTGIVVQFFVARWYSGYTKLPRQTAKSNLTAIGGLSRGQIGFALAILIALTLSKNVYMAGMSSYYSFFLIGDFGIAVGHAQLYLFAFLAASAAGTFIGGPLADRYGRRNIIWLSILGTTPFSILLPYADLFWSFVLIMCAGFVMASAFSIIVVYAHELLPGKVGMISGLFFGLAFGLGGLGSVILGLIADVTSIAYIMKLCSYLPLLGLLTVFLPRDEALRGKAN